MIFGKRIGIYLRCSTSDQSVELQRRELTSFAEARGWINISYYEDKASGTNTNRKDLKRLIKHARERKLDTILVWKLDRFARSLKDLILMLQELSDLDVAFVSLKDNIDFSTSTGRLMLHIIGAFAEFEASIIRERVRAGIANARSKGKRLGRPQTVDTEKVLRLRREGHSLKQIADQLKVSKSAVHKTLRKLSLQVAENTGSKK